MEPAELPSRSCMFSGSWSTILNNNGCASPLNTCPGYMPSDYLCFVCCVCCVAVAIVCCRLEGGVVDREWISLVSQVPGSPYSTSPAKLFYGQTPRQTTL
jgi:hypothetical protein